MLYVFSILRSVPKWLIGDKCSSEHSN